MEITYIPGEGAVETRGGVPLHRTISSPQEAQESAFGSLEDYQEHQLANTARGLSRRAQTALSLESTTDQDLDEGTFNPAAAAVEARLQQVQQQLYRSTDPLAKAQLAHEAQQLASQLVTHRYAGAEDPGGSDLAETYADSVRAELGGAEVDTILANAAEVLTAEVAAEINEDFLNDADPLIQKAGFVTLQQLKNNPQAFATNRSEWRPLDSSTVDQLSEAFGEQRASEIQAISYAVAAGKTTPAQALKLAAKDPGLFAALVKGAQQGYFKLMF